MHSESSKTEVSTAKTMKQIKLNSLV